MLERLSISNLLDYFGEGQGITYKGFLSMCDQLEIPYRRAHAVHVFRRHDVSQ